MGSCNPISTMTVSPSGISPPGRPTMPSNPIHSKESTSDASNGTTRQDGAISETRKLRHTNYGNRLRLIIA